VVAYLKLQLGDILQVLANCLPQHMAEDISVQQLSPKAGGKCGGSCSCGYYFSAFLC